MSDQLTAGIVSAIVALTIGAISFLVNFLNLRLQRERMHKELDAQREKLERELEAQRVKQEKDLASRFTEKLYELRLAAYPEAFDISEQLRGDYIFEQGRPPSYFLAVKQQLDQWNRSKAAFVLSPASMKAVYELRSLLAEVGMQTESVTEEQVKKIWRGKNQFRKCLRADVGLLYQEDANSTNGALLPNPSVHRTLRDKAAQRR